MEITPFKITEIFNKETIDEFAPYLRVLPDRIRDEENGRYCFPQQYHNKVYRLSDKFIIFNATAYEEIPFSQVILLFNLFSQKFNNSNSIPENINEQSQPNINKDDTDELLSIIKDVMDKYNDLIENQNNISNVLENIIETNNKFESKFENINDILKTIDTNSINDLKLSIDDLLNDYSETNTQIHAHIKEIEDKLNNQESNLPQLIQNTQVAEQSDIQIDKTQLINDIGTSIWNKLQIVISETVDSKTFDQFKKLIEQQISNLYSKINNHDDTLPINSDQPIKLDIKTLCDLKSAGFSPTEILQLQQFKLI